MFYIDQFQGNCFLTAFGKRHEATDFIENTKCDFIGLSVGKNSCWYDIIIMINRKLYPFTEIYLFSFSPFFCKALSHFSALAHSIPSCPSHSYSLILKSELNWNIYTALHSLKPVYFCYQIFWILKCSLFSFIF